MTTTSLHTEADRVSVLTPWIQTTFAVSAHALNDVSPGLAGPKNQIRRTEA
jgi:hypothetical protein